MTSQKVVDSARMDMEEPNSLKSRVEIRGNRCRVGISEHTSDAYGRLKASLERRGMVKRSVYVTREFWSDWLVYCESRGYKTCRRLEVLGRADMASADRFDVRTAPMINVVVLASGDGPHPKTWIAHEDELPCEICGDQATKLAYHYLRDWTKGPQVSYMALCDKHYETSKDKIPITHYIDLTKHNIRQIKPTTEDAELL